jgi:hypothetical protein
VSFTYSDVKLLTDSRAAAAMPMGGRTNNKLAAESSQRQSRRRQRSAIQTIYDISKDIFAAATQGFQPLPSDMARLSGFLSTTSLITLCLSLAVPPGLARGKEWGARPAVEDGVCMGEVLSCWLVFSVSGRRWNILHNYVLHGYLTNFVFVLFTHARYRPKPRHTI